MSAVLLLLRLCDLLCFSCPSMICLFSCSTTSTTGSARPLNRRCWDWSCYSATTRVQQRVRSLFFNLKLLLETRNGGLSVVRQLSSG